MRAMHNRKLITMCCECRRVKLNGRWLREADVAIRGARLTHGYCPTCYARARLLAVSAIAQRNLAAGAG
jgi:hypothetical protein